MAEVNDVLAGSLGDMNVGLGAAVGAINPMAAQLDAAIAIGLSPLQVDLSASLNASLALQASLSLSISDPLANIRAALAALIELQASLTAALSLPPITLSLSAELAAAASISAALSAKLGGLKLLIDAMVAIKIPAIRLAADLAADLSLGGVVVLSFDGISDGTNLQTIGNKIQARFSDAGGIGFGAIGPTDHVSGIIVVTDFAPTFSAMGRILIT